LPLLLGVVTVVITYLIPPTFVAEAAFVPEGRGAAGLSGALSGLASQFGVAFGSGTGDSPEFYVDLIKSRELLEPILLTPVRDPRTDDTLKTTILNLLDAGGKNRADSLYRGLRSLRQSISATADYMSSIVLVRVESRYPTICALIANRLLDDVGRFNSQMRRSRAGARRQFLGERLREAQSSLAIAEDSVRLFEQQNRTWENAPDLRFQHSRLSRQLSVNQEVYLTLRREYEVAQAEEVNDTPVITVIQTAVPPTRKIRPKRALSGILGMLAGGILVIGIAVFDGYRVRLRADPLAEQELTEFHAQLGRSPVSRLLRAHRDNEPSRDV